MRRRTAGGTVRAWLVLVPGLAEPLPTLPPTPTLDWLLAAGAAAVTGTPGLSATLLDLFGAGPAAGSAPYALAGDDPAWDRAGWWLHAAPVHLRADRDRLRLFDARLLAITPAEATALTAELNAHFAADGLHFSAPAPARWYVRPTPPPDLNAPPLEAVTGRALPRDAVTGADARRWAALMNEAQMLLFQSPVNQARQRAGRPAVNGLWSWGGGHWQPLTAPVPLARVQGDAPLLRGLAAAAGLPTGPAPALAPSEWPAGLTLTLFPDLADALAGADAAGCQTALEGLEGRLAAALADLRRGHLDRIDLDAGDGRRWTLDRRAFGWRRLGPLWGRLRRGLRSGLWRHPPRFTDHLAAPPPPEPSATPAG